MKDVYVIDVFKTNSKYLRGSMVRQQVSEEGVASLVTSDFYEFRNQFYETDKFIVAHTKYFGPLPI
jgi:hypothetical protein